MAMPDRQLVKLVALSTPHTSGMSQAIQEQLAEIPALKQQLSTAMQEIASLKQTKNEQFDTL
jgi:hypothetical protein